MSNAVVTRKSLVEQAFDLAVPAPELAGEAEERKALLETQRSLLPIEEKAGFRVQQRIDELDVALKRGRFAESMLPLEPLGWRWRNGMPKLALLSLGGPHFSISARRSRDPGGQLFHSTNPDLPKPLKDKYLDVIAKAESYCIRRGSSRSFTFTFEGVIPASVRMNIVEAMRSGRFEHLFMLVEAPEQAWRVESHKGISRREAMREAFEAWNLDPLILGWAAEELWVIDKFDLTTLEQYVLDEFQQKALLPGS